jgi:YHS domain-containing protein
MKTWIKGTIRLVTAIIVGAGVVSHAGETVKKANYPVEVCVVTGKKLGSMGDPYIYLHEGREIRFCCSGCIGKFKADSVNYLAKLDKLIVEKQKADYPLTVCVVSDEPLGEMGETVNVVYNNRLVRFCCKGCVEDFKEEPTPFLEKLDGAKSVDQPAHEPKQKHDHGQHKH